MGTFFSVLQKKTKLDNIFLPKQKKFRGGGGGGKRPPYWLQKRTPAGPETEVFFKGWPQGK